MSNYLQSSCSRDTEYKDFRTVKIKSANARILRCRPIFNEWHGIRYCKIRLVDVGQGMFWSGEIRLGKAMYGSEQSGFKEVEIVTTVAPSDLIVHESLYEQFGIDDFKKAKIADYESFDILIESVRLAEFDYMFLIETLRRQLLEGMYGT